MGAPDAAASPQSDRQRHGPATGNDLSSPRAQSRESRADSPVCRGQLVLHDPLHDAAQAEDAHPDAALQRLAAGVGAGGGHRQAQPDVQLQVGGGRAEVQGWELVAHT